MSTKSAEITIGISDGRASSRVLKPPGGGHSNIFAEPASEMPRARPKYNQQNSSNMNFCMNTVDPNEAVKKIVHEKVPTPTEPAPAAPVVSKPKPPQSISINNITPAVAPTTNGTNGILNGGNNVATVPKSTTPVEKQSTPKTGAAAPSSPSQGFERVRQPPGGYSSGLW